jgi:hypothetical protein
MKKIITLTLAVFLLFQLTSCQPAVGTESSAPEKETVDLYALTEDEVVLDNETWEDEALIGTQRSLPFVEGVSTPLFYKNSFHMGDMNHAVDRYWSEDGKQIIVLNRETGKVEVMTIEEFPPDYPLCTREITRDEAFVLFKDFIAEYYPEVDLAKWKDLSAAYEDGYEFRYYLYLRGIQVDYISVIYDLCGNLMRFSTGKYSEVMPSVSLSEERCGQAGIERAVEHFAAQRGFDYIKNNQTTYCTTGYLKAHGLHTIIIDISFTVVYKDGTEEEVTRRFFLPYDDNGEHISFRNKTPPLDNLGNL